MSNDIKTNEAENLKKIIKTHTSTGILTGIPFWKSPGDALLEKIAPLQTITAILNQVKHADASLKPGLMSAVFEWAKVKKDHVFHAIAFPDQIAKIIPQSTDEKLVANRQELINKLKQGSKDDLMVVANELIFSLILKPMTANEVTFFVDSIDSAMQEEENKNELDNEHTP